MTAPAPRRTPGSLVFAVGLLFALIGVVMLVPAHKLYVAQQEFLTRSERAAGTVVAFEQSVLTNSRNHYQRQTFYAPVFTFADRTGTTHRVTSKVSKGGEPGYGIGQSVSVLYNRDRPAEAQLDTFFVSWGGAAVLGGLGTAFVIAGGAVAWSGVRTLLRPGGVPPEATVPR